MTAIPQPASPSSAFTGVYDAWNRLTQLIGVATYSYDGLNRRATKTISGVLRDLYYSNDWQVHEERVGGATTADRQFVWGQRYIDDLVLRDRSTERLYALQDANWNVTAIVNTSGMVQERYSYTVYGLPTFLNPDFTVRSGGSDYAWETLYCGYRWDGESGLYQVRNRYLNPLLGLWITRDPLMFAAGDSNVSRYVNNNPITLIDGRGLGCFVDFACTTLASSKPSGNCSTDCVYKCTDIKRTNDASAVRQVITCDALRSIPMGQLVVYTYQEVSDRSCQALDWLLGFIPRCPSYKNNPPCPPMLPPMGIGFTSVEDGGALYGNCSIMACLSACNKGGQAAKICGKLKNKAWAKSCEVAFAAGGQVCRDVCSVVCNKP